MALIVVPAVITLVVTLLRLVGELRHWSIALFNPEAGGGGALVGISWLIPVFGAYFAYRLQKAGQGPARPWRALGLALLAFALNTAATLAGFALKLPFVPLLAAWTVTSWIAIAIAFRGWPSLGRTLLAYAFAARVPVALLMLFAIYGNWGTHYDVAPPNAPQVDAMAPLLKWFWIGLVPQMTVWVYLTVVGGMVVGSVVAAIAGRRSAA
jgi:hypothetical protein